MGKFALPMENVIDQYQYNMASNLLSNKKIAIVAEAPTKKIYIYHRFANRHQILLYLVNSNK